MSDTEEKSYQRKIKKAKNAGWKVITFVLGALFVLSITACILFATGLIEIDETDDGQSFEFVSPLTDKDDEDSTDSTDSANSTAEESEESKPNNAAQDVPTVKQEQFAGYDFKINGLYDAAKANYPQSTAIIFKDLRPTMNGDYLVAHVLVSHDIYGDGKYFYRSTSSDGEWILIRAISFQTPPNCYEMSALERKVVRESYPEPIKICFNADGSSEAL